MKFVLPLLLSFSLLLASGYREYEHKYNYELTPIVGYTHSEKNLDIADEPSIGIRMMFNNYGVFRPEFSIDRSLTNVKFGNKEESPITRIGLNEFYELDQGSKWNPYVLTGAGIVNFENAVGENVNDVFFNYGVGFKLKLPDSDALFRTEVKHIIEVDGLNQRIGIFLGFSMPFGKTYRYVDSDGDGVYDVKDKCLHTPKGIKVDLDGCRVKEIKDSDHDGVMDPYDNCPGSSRGIIVDTKGCEIDSDGDGVSDSKDKCKDSKTGVVVNQHGCEIDSDNDGVVDSNDKCPSTLKGLKVDDHGCEFDDDKDGVKNSIDKCPTSPIGANVNQVGCELDDDNDGIQNSLDQCKQTPVGVSIDTQGCGLDRDKDGVYDDLDQCLDTPEGFDVDDKGCVNQKRLYISFKAGTAEFSSDTVSDSIKDFSNFLADNPFHIVIEGHTSSDGSATLNYFLSEDRANKIKEELLFNGLAVDRVEIAAFGEALPMVSNSDKKGRSQNRRIAIKLFNSKEESLNYIANTHSALAESLVQELVEKSE